jgi:hypothetical protein
MFWGLNTARGWLHHTWTLVPLTIGVQLLLVQILELSSVRGVIVFALMTQVPNLLVSAFMALSGFHRVAESSNLTAREEA